jgi:hypothetical protein
MNAMSINLAQAFGERKQTASLLATTANRLVRAARALRRGRLDSFVEALSIKKERAMKGWHRVRRTPKSKRIASHWLEYQYGWKPLLQDAYGAAELLARHIRDDSDHHHAFGRGSHRTKSRTIINLNGIRDTHSDDSRTDTHIWCRYRLDSAARAVLGATGLNNPALLAWELLPFSFVVDWFIPIGNYVESLTAFDGFTFVDGGQVNLTERRYEHSRSGTSKKTYNHPVYTWQSEEFFGGRWLLQLNRTKLTSFPGASRPSFRNPIGGNPLERLVTAVSLLRVLFGKS